MEDFGEGVHHTSYIMVFRGYRGGGEGQSTPTEYKEGTIRIDFLLTAKEGGLREYIYVIYQTGGPYWEKLCTRSWTDRPWLVNNIFSFF